MIDGLLAIVPDDALQVLDACMTRFRIHPMSAMNGSGARFDSKYKQWQDDPTPSNWERHDGFNAHWGLRPINVERAGYIALTAQWTMRGRAKSYKFKWWAMSLNFSGHTMQRDANSHGLPKELMMSSLLAQLDLVVQRFVAFECHGSSCSHANPALKNGEVFTVPGLTTSGMAPVEARVW